MAVRAALFSYFDADHAARVVHAIADSGMPAGVRVHVGTYGVNADTSDLVRTLEGGRYSPMFKATRTDVWESRRLSPRDEAKVGRALRGPVPPTRRLFALSAR